MLTCASATDAGYPSNFVADPFLYLQVRSVNPVELRSTARNVVRFSNKATDCNGCGQCSGMQLICHGMCLVKKHNKKKYVHKRQISHVTKPQIWLFLSMLEPPLRFPELE